jgi:hypothetical protein
MVAVVYDMVEGVCAGSFWFVPPSWLLICRVCLTRFCCSIALYGSLRASCMPPPAAVARGSEGCGAPAEEATARWAACSSVKTLASVTYGCVVGRQDWVRKHR